jgi:hypothetical protein
MTRWKCLGAALIAGVLFSQAVVEDPVVKAQAQRAASGDNGDLPPVPRGILEPPPLPPPELNVKDTKGYRVSRHVRKSRVRGVKVAKGAKGQPAVAKVRKKLPKKKP